MAEITGIAWCHHTFNGWIGCTKVSPGCDHCYAEALDKRHRWRGGTHWGQGVPRMRTSDANWREPLKWDRKASAAGERRLVFCSSLADVFDNEVPEAWRHGLWDLIYATPALTWLLLTKRIGNAAKMIPWGVSNVLPNVWLGTSVVNQEEADRDIPKLLAVPAAKRFISYEPALGPVTWPGFDAGKSWCPICKDIVADSLTDMHEAQHGVSLFEAFNPQRHCSAVYDLIHWIIVGGESKQGKDLARPFNIEWARSTLRQCRDAGVAFFMKQTGSDYTALYERVQRNRAGADPSEWPEDLRVQEFPA